MIYLPQEEIYITNPADCDDWTLKIKKYLSTNLRRGLCILQIPEHITDKQRKKEYKVGFLNALLEQVYPDHTKKINYEVISEQYQLWCSYRQIDNLIKSYNESGFGYIKS